MRKTKIICTIGPKTCNYESLEKLASLGMNVARFNMSHGDHLWHSKVIKSIKTINSKGVYSIATLMDTRGGEVRTGDLKQEITIKKGNQFTFTIDRRAKYEKNTVEVSYDGFVDDVKVDDIILIDGGLLSFKVLNKTDTDVITTCLDGGVISSRRHLNIKGKSARIPTVTNKDWQDIDFAMKEGVDFIALSFVKDSKTVIEVKNYLKKHKTPIDVIAKIENAAALPKIAEILHIADGVMIARGDLGAEVPIEDVPLLQEEIVFQCRLLGKPVIIATHLLESMIINPTPTRAEVADIAQAVREKVDSIMLSGETATGEYPYKAISVMDKVASRIEQNLMENKKIIVEETNNDKIELARSACIMANNLNTQAILVFTRRGYMATLISRCRPNSTIFAFTNMSTVRRKLNIYWGVTSFRIEFSNDPEKTIQRAIEHLKRNKLLKKENQVIVVSDILAGKEFVETIQIRRIS